jgi:hypothetical protein
MKVASVRKDRFDYPSMMARGGVAKSVAKIRPVGLLPIIRPPIGRLAFPGISLGTPISRLAPFLQLALTHRPPHFFYGHDHIA